MVMPALVGGFGNKSSKYLLPPINNNTFFVYCISSNFFKAIPNLSCMLSASLGKYFYNPGLSKTYSSLVDINNISNNLGCLRSVRQQETRDYNGQNLDACMLSCSSESSLLGPYLAGLIEGNGNFNSTQQLVIVFNSLDASLAYYIKNRLGFGSVKKVKDKNAFLLVISAKKGIEKVIHLINGKLITDNKYNQIIQNILNHRSYADFKKEIDFKLNLKKDLKNHWLAGFSEADTSFQIKIFHRNNKVEVRLNFQIDQKNKDVLLLIKDFLGGNIGYRKSQDLYFYGSTSFGSAKNVINYFDKYHLLSSKHVNYLKWRKAYLIIQNKDYLTENDQDKLIKLKISIDRLSDATV